MRRPRGVREVMAIGLLLCLSIGLGMRPRVTQAGEGLPPGPGDKWFWDTYAIVLLQVNQVVYESEGSALIVAFVAEVERTFHGQVPKGSVLTIPVRIPESNGLTKSYRRGIRFRTTREWIPRVGRRSVLLLRKKSAQDGGSPMYSFVHRGVVPGMMVPREIQDAIDERVVASLPVLLDRVKILDPHKRLALAKEGLTDPNPEIRRFSQSDFFRPTVPGDILGPSLLNPKQQLSLLLPQLERETDPRVLAKLFSCLAYIGSHIQRPAQEVTSARAMTESIKLAITQWVTNHPTTPERLRKLAEYALTRLERYVTKSVKKEHADP